MRKPFNRIKAVLAEKNVKSIDLAQELGVNKTIVSRWCNNKAQPKPDTFVKIANALDVDVRELIVSTKGK